MNTNYINVTINFKSVLFFPSTPGGILVEDIKKREEELKNYNEERIKIVEKGRIK